MSENETNIDSGSTETESVETQGQGAEQSTQGQGAEGGAQGTEGKREQRNSDHVPMGRFREVVRERNETRRQISELQRQLSELQGRGQQGQGQQQTEQAPKRPNPRDFQSEEAWNAAMDKYEEERGKFHETAAERRIREQAEREGQQRQGQQRSQEALDRAIEGFDKGFADLAKADPKVADALPVFAEMRHENPATWFAVVQHKNGPQIAVEMARDELFAEEVMSANPFQAGQIIAERLAELKTRTKTTPSTTTTVGGGTTSNGQLSDSMSEAEWMAARSKQGR